MKGIENLNYEKIKSQIQEMLKTEEFDEKSNLLELGLSSIQIMRLANMWRKQGSKATFAKLISSPYLNKWCHIILEGKQENHIEVEEEKTEINMYEPFPLTDVQYAYWIGRFGGQYLGNVGCHGYLEVDGENVDPKRLAMAWKKLQEHHPMLRVRFTKDGMQQIMKEPKYRELKVYDYRDNEKDGNNHLDKIRKQLSHRLLDIENGQIAELQLTMLPNGKTRIHFDIDLLVADVQSYQIILRDLAALYARDAKPNAPEEWNFANYLHKEKIYRQKEVEEAKHYWQKRLETLPGAPELPIVNNNSEVIYPEFKRRKLFIEGSKWGILRNMATSRQLTPAMVLLCLYGRIIHRWSENDKFLINVPLFNRQSRESGIEDVVADFTTLLLLEMDFQKPVSFEKQAREIQKTFHEDMEHIAYSGVEVQRQYVKEHPGVKTIAPVVFSCNLGIPLINKEFQENLGHMEYMISQTPQVWLDFQVFDMDGGVLMIWDSIDELFPENMLDDMLKTYEKLLNWLIDSEDNWSKIPYIDIENQIEVRKEKNLYDDELDIKCIHTEFFNRAKDEPDKIAIYEPVKDIELTYSKLKEHSLRIGGYLKKIGVKKGDYVGISLERGHHQIEAIMGVLAVGATYVPIGLQQPQSRREIIYKKANIDYVIFEKHTPIYLNENTKGVPIEEALNEEPLSEIVSTQLDDSAYVIFTSGSTGEPKGVEISHRAAFNTIASINKLYNVTNKDKVLAVSSVDFDLSVYDIFGLLSVGGSLILISKEQYRNPGDWIKLMEKYRITIWNSVPVILNMLLLDGKGNNTILEDCRLVFLSGDWIGLDLPERLKEIAPNANLIAMGGATEASIWSNYFEVNLPLPKEWASIPYGKPLPNQKYRVVDSWKEDCPDWVAGELWIGGKGVAKGYIGDSMITDAQFINVDEEMWYRTGDYGKFWTEGIIEFLGRKDHQVKIRGHRIELEEIEAAIKKHPEVEQAIVLPLGEKEESKYLAGFLVSNKSGVGEAFTKIYKDEELLGHLSNGLYELIDKYCKNHNEVIDNFILYKEKSKKLAVYYICNILSQISKYSKVHDGYTLQMICDKGKVLPKYHGMVAKWYELLNKNGVVSKISGDSYRNLRDLNSIEEPFGIEIEELKKFIKQFTDHGKDVLQGSLNPIELMYGLEKETPDKFSNKVPGAYLRNDIAIEGINFIVNKLCEKKKKIRILEIGARNLEFTKKVLNNLQQLDVEYSCTDTSKYFEKIVLEELSMFSNICYEILDIDEAPDFQGFLTQSYDIIIASNTIHRSKNLNKSLAYLEKLLTQDGILVMLESTENTSLQQVTTAFVEDGFSHFRDFRKNSCEPLLTVTDWCRLIKEIGFSKVHVFPEEKYDVASYNQHVFFCYGSEEKVNFNRGKLDEFLSNKLPRYMIPSTYFILKDIPITSNGKIDRKFLTMIGSNEKKDHIVKANPETDLEKQVASIWKEVLNQNRIGLDDSFYDLGGDSLIATKLSVEIKKILNIEISLETIFKYPVFCQFVNEIEKLLNSSEEKFLLEEFPKVEVDSQNENEPFPLSDVQQSYWIGRSGMYSLGDVSTHCYFEMDCQNLDVDRLETAWNYLIKRHGMMRAVVLPNGEAQRILRKVPEYKIKLYDFMNESKVSIDKELIKVRESMEHQKFNPEKWPLFDIKLSKCSSDFSRLHLSFDNIIFDGFSIFHLFSEWEKLYRNLNFKLPQIELSFRDYMLTVENIKKTEKYKNDLNYWRERAKELAPAPELPIEKQTYELTNQKFTRFEMKLPNEQWMKIQEMASKYRITPSVVLMAAYGEVLGAYSKSQKFTINLTRFNRISVHKDIDNLIGDFTSLTLLEIDNSKGKNFYERCQNVQEQLLKDLDHPYVSGVVVEREIRKISGNSNEATMPVVFTSGLGVNKNNENNYLGKINYGKSQTPQVWLDHQVSEQDGDLILSWDAICDLFPHGIIEEMFSVYKNLLYTLSQDINSWEVEKNSLLITPNISVREEANNTTMPISEETLISLYKKSFIENKDKFAVITEDVSITYKELENQSNLIAQRLLKEEVLPNTLVGVVMEKGWEQVVATLGILKAKAAYLPIDAKNPIDRINMILNKGKVNVVLIQSKLKDNINLSNEVKIITVNDEIQGEFTTTLPKVTKEDLAYVIFTSGSTGEPKGVTIDHKSALNTIIDINRRFNVGSTDKAIALSNLNFDLSVYDIFGMLIAGGAIVIPNENKAKDPGHWIKLIKEYNITIWNSVPKFLQMFIEYTSKDKDELKDTLRLILLSGDWIPIGIADDVKKVFKNVRVIGLGGATEASIWSNMYEINQINPLWKSIPYGMPLSNQKFFILNDIMEDCPTWVPGNLYIGGEGLALGYWGDEEKTRATFITHPRTNERIYITGDLGRYLPDGNIEFLGRNDYQVKVNGYRIELGEIEAAIRSLEKVKDAVVTFSKSDGKVYLVGHIIMETLDNNDLMKKICCKGEFDERSKLITDNCSVRIMSFDGNAFIKELKKKIPDYMIPLVYLAYEEFPLTANGKVDRNVLATIGGKQRRKKDSNKLKPETKEQKEIADVWLKVIENTEVGISENFFASGGDSLNAIQFINLIKEKYNYSISLQDLFEHPSILELSEFISRKGQSEVEEIIEGVF